MEVPTPPARIDVEANGRILRELLDLADKLPRRSEPELAAPPFAKLARRASTMKLGIDLDVL